MKKILAVALAGILSVTACGQIEYAITLEEDLSGTATLDMGLDLEKMAFALATIQKAFTGDTTGLTEEELATAREDLIAEMDDEEWNEEEALADALIEAGVSPMRIRVVAAGNSEPVLAQAYDERRKEINRRVEVIVRESLVADYEGDEANFEEK